MSYITLWQHYFPDNKPQYPGAISDVAGHFERKMRSPNERTVNEALRRMLHNDMMDHVHWFSR
jgi:hypothetical protein